jgi:hypothetical protein
MSDKLQFVAALRRLFWNQRQTEVCLTFRQYVWQSSSTIGVIAIAEDGYRLWLRYDLLPKQVIDVYRSRITSVLVPGDPQSLMRFVRSSTVARAYQSSHSCFC